MQNHNITVFFHAVGNQSLCTTFVGLDLHLRISTLPSYQIIFEHPLFVHFPSDTDTVLFFPWIQDTKSITFKRTSQGFLLAIIDVDVLGKQLRGLVLKPTQRKSFGLREVPSLGTSLIEIYSLTWATCLGNSPTCKSCFRHWVHEGPPKTPFQLLHKGGWPAVSSKHRKYLKMRSVDWSIETLGVALACFLIHRVLG